jgi:hypothetical protein
MGPEVQISKQSACQVAVNPGSLMVSTIEAEGTGCVQHTKSLADDKAVLICSETSNGARATEKAWALLFLQSAIANPI